MLPVKLLNKLKILTQPNDYTCGPTSLHAVYQYFHDPVSLQQVIDEVSFLEEGGTLAVMLGCHALNRGYRARIYTYNLHIFDPTWFLMSREKIMKRLREQLAAKGGRRLRKATEAYLEFLRLGGELKQEDLTPALLNRYFEKGIPLLSGLSATYLYNCARERTNERNESLYDDVLGVPLGHFVVLCGFGADKEHVIVADPYKENPFFKNNYYEVKTSRLINSIMLGMVTSDANFLVIEPPASHFDPHQVPSTLP